jgi:hypothetical protein
MAVRPQTIIGGAMAVAFAATFGVALFGRGGHTAVYDGPTDTIAYATDAPGNGATAVYLLPASDLQKMHLVQAVDNPAKLIVTQADGVFSTAWSPDGMTVYYLARRMEGQHPHADLWAVRADGTAGHLVERDFVSADDAYRYPLFALASFEGGEQAIAHLSPPESEATPSLSPDGAREAVRVQGIDTAFVCVLDAGARTPPASLAGCFSDSVRTSYPAWSPR